MREIGRAPVESTVALLSLIVGSLLVLMPIAMWAFPVIVPDSTAIPPQHQTAESFVFLVTFAILVPVGALVLLNRRWTLPDRLLASGSDYPWLLLGSVALAALLVRPVSIWTDIGALKLSLAAGLLWFVGVGIISLRSLRRGGPAVTRPQMVKVAAVLLSLAALSTLVRWGHAELSVLLLLLAFAVAAAWFLADKRPPRFPRAGGIAIDIGLIALILLAVPDLYILGGFGEPQSYSEAIYSSITQFHQNLFFGAVNQVLGGEHLLVDVVSQYGVGLIYFIALWFQFAPVNYGMLGLLDGSLTAVTFAAGYAVLRMAGVSRIFSALTLLVGIVALVYVQDFPVGALLQQGALRFSLPVAIIVAEVGAARFPGGSRWWRVVSLLFLGLSSIWAFEAFLYAGATWIGLLAIRTVATESGQIRFVRKELLAALAAVVSFHLGFALATLAVSGSLPDWGKYLTYIRDFLGGEVGTITYDFEPFAPAFLLGLVYVASSVGLISAAALRRQSIVSRPAIWFAITGLTVYGIALYSYLVNRSLDSIVPSVSLPGLLLGMLWLQLAWSASRSLGARRLVIATAGALAALLIASAWGSAGERFNRTPLGSLLPGGPSLGQRLDRLRNMPEISPSASSGVDLLDRYMPEPDPAYVLARPDLATEILIRAGRINPFGYPDAKEASWVEEPHLENLDRAVAQMRGGDRLLLDPSAIESAERLRSDPGTDREALTAATTIQAIQLRALSEIDRRFKFKVLARGAGGLVIVELVPR